MKTLQEPDHTLNVIFCKILVVIAFALIFAVPLANAESPATPKGMAPFNKRIESAIVFARSTSTENVSIKENRTAKQEKQFALVDVAAISADNPSQAIINFSFKKPTRTIACDILIVGGGLGGVSAAIKIAQLAGSEKKGRSSRPRIILTEETDWLGGQMTAQGVPALDENYLVETSGATGNYQQLRSKIRDVYRPDLSPTAPHPPHKASKSQINPGNCWVSRLSFEPKVALAQINRLVTDSAKNIPLEVHYRLKPFMVKSKLEKSTGRDRADQVKGNSDSSRLISVYFLDLNSGETINIRPKLCLDATECGELIALAKLPYSCGSDSRTVTGEPHAPVVGDPNNVQDFTFPFVIELRRGESHKIDKPARYDELNAAGKFSFAGYKMFESVKTPDGNKFLPFWEYRRLIDSNNFSSPSYANDLAVINWDGNDVRGLNIIDQPADIEADHLAFGKLVSLGFLYWLQNDAPRDDGGNGYPELMLHKDVLGTKDGLSKYPYIRESRRAKTKYTIVEQDIVANHQSGSRARIFNDTVGIGLYPVDIHGKQEIPGAGQATKPFQIPLGSLIPLNGGNLLPACKNIGTTHITNGAYRLHPIEWSVGEAQGTLAFLALNNRIRPETVYGDLKLLRQLQKNLVESGVPIYWYNDVPVEHPAFAAIQFLAVTDIIAGSKNHLHFCPDQQITRAQAADAIAKTLFQSPLTTSQNKFAGRAVDLKGVEDVQSNIEACLSTSIMKLDSNNRFRPGDPLTEEELSEIEQNKLLQNKLLKIADKGREKIHAQVRVAEKPDADSHPISRAEFAAWLYNIASSKRYLGCR